MTTFTIYPANWTAGLATAIEQAKDGDTIIVDSDDKAELAARAIARMRPSAVIYVKVEK